MTKFSRFDSRNKKRGKHKQQSIYKDLKIKNVSSCFQTKQKGVHSSQSMVEYYYNEGEYNDRQFKPSDTY